MLSQFTRTQTEISCLFKVQILINLDLKQNPEVFYLSNLMVLEVKTGPNQKAEYRVCFIFIRGAKPDKEDEDKEEEEEDKEEEEEVIFMSSNSQSKINVGLCLAAATRSANESKALSFEGQSPQSRPTTTSLPPAFNWEQWGE